MTREHTVFIIEDDAPVRDSLLHLLRGEGVRARGFASGADFFAQLPEEAAACVITDIRMPGMDGVEVVRRVADLQDRSWPVIVITGHADVPTAVDSVKRGAFDFCEKPFSDNALVDRIEQALALSAERLEALRQQGEVRQRQREDRHDRDRHDPKVVKLPVGLVDGPDVLEDRVGEQTAEAEEVGSILEGAISAERGQHEQDEQVPGLPPEAGDDQVGEEDVVACLDQRLE